MKTAIFLQARMGSTRLPGKVLKTIGGRSILEITLERLSRVKSASFVLLVTSEKPENDKLEAEAVRCGFPAFRGAEENILDRFVQASRSFPAEAIVRVTADCPLIDPELIEEGIRLFYASGVDFLGNTQPVTHPHGMQFEITKREALERMWKKQRAKFVSDQAFQDVPMNPGTPLMDDPTFQKEYMLHEPNLSGIRITVDYAEDLELLNKVCALLPEGKRSLSDIVALFAEHPELAEINKMHNEYSSHRK